MPTRGPTSTIRAMIVCAVIAAPLVGAQLGCADAEPFSCTDDRACDLEPDGRCEPDGHCSYPDDTCPLGRRYRDAASGAACIGGDATGTLSGSSGSGDDTSSSSG